LLIHVGSTRPIHGWFHLSQPIPSDLRSAVGSWWRPRAKKATAIYVEDGLERLTIDDSLRFLRGCRRALTKTGTLRIRTTNLDWVFLRNCRPSTGSGEEALEACLQGNLAFRRGGTEFLYNDSTLRAALREAGFAHVSFVTPGHSETPELRRLESDENTTAPPDPPMFLIAEASGIGERTEIPRHLFSDMTQVTEWRLIARWRAKIGRILRRTGA
jgi:hypothetical protein